MRHTHEQAQQDDNSLLFLFLSYLISMANNKK